MLIDGGTLLFLGSATVAANPSEFIQSASVSVSGNAAFAGDLTGIFRGVSSMVGTATFDPVPTTLRLAELDLAGDADFAPVQPDYLLELELAGEATASLAAQMSLAGELGLSGEASVADIASQLVAAGEVAMAGDAEASLSAAMSYGGELVAAGDAVMTAQALADDEGAVDFYGGAAVAAEANAAYSAGVGMSAGSQFQALAIIHPPLAERLMIPERYIASDPYEGLRTKRPPHDRPEKLQIDTGARTRLIDVDETATRKIGS